MRKISNKLMIVLLSITMALLVGCGSGEKNPTKDVVTEDVKNNEEANDDATDEQSEEANGDAVDEQEEATEEAQVIKDILGNEINLDAPATKLVGTHNPTMNIAVILGGGGKYIAGFGNKSMASGLYSYVFPELEQVAQIGKGKEINFEECIAQGADLAILPERFASQSEQFAEVGITAAVILPNEENYDTIATSLETLGALLGEEERATKIVQDFRDSIAKAEKLVEGAQGPTALFLGSSTPASVANGPMLQSIMMETVGIQNMAKDVEGEGGFVEVSVEEIIGWNPEVIYIPAYAKYTVEDVMSDPAWSQISAVQNNKVYVFPSTALEPWDYPTPSVAIGLNWMIQNVYPDLYTMEQVVEDANKYYDVVYGKTFTAQEMGLE